MDKDIPRSLHTDLLIIACEHSGDQHIANVLQDVYDKNSLINVCAFAGKETKDVGACLLFDMTKHAVLGATEVIKKAVFFKKLINKIVTWVEVNKPNVICMVDSPALNLRIAKILFEKKLLNKSGGKIRLYYYISPQIWAWKAKRRFQIAKYVDSLATIFPFERKFYSDTNLDVVFTGHPFMKDGKTSKIIYKKYAPILLLPGSRKSSISKIFPGILESFKYILKSKPNLTGIIVYPDDAILAFLRKILNKKFPCLLKNIEFVRDNVDVEASAAIMSSGTMSLRCCLGGIPGAIVYKVSEFTYIIGKMMVKINYLGIANIILGYTAWPEFIQHDFKPHTVGDFILKCIDDEQLVNDARDNAEKIKHLLDENVDMTAGEWLSRALS